MFNCYNWQDSTLRLFITSVYFWPSPTVVLFLKISPVWIYPTSGRTYIWTINLHFQQRFFFFPLFSLCFGQGVTTRPKIGLKWCAGCAISRVSRIKGFKSQCCLGSQKILCDLKKCFGISKIYLVPQKMLWDLKKMLWDFKKCIEI